MTGTTNDRPRAFWSLLGCITALALAIRVARVALVTAKQVPGNDAYYYHAQAALLVKGHWFVQPLAYLKYGTFQPGADHPPGFVTLLAVLDRIGLGSTASQRYVMAVLGTVTVVVIALTLARLVSARAGLIGGLIAAVYPNLWFNDGEIMSETMSVLAFTVAVAACFRYRATHHWKWLAAMAFAVTIDASARPETVLLLGLMVLPAVIGATSGDRRRRLAHLGLAVVVPVVILAPWSIFNSVRFGEPVLLSTGAGQTLLQGNCGVAYYTDAIGMDVFACLPPADPHHGTTPRNLAADDARYRKKALDYMGKHAKRLPLVVLAREGRTWGVWQPGQQRSFDNYMGGRGSRGLIHIQQWTWWITAAVALPGMWLWRRRQLALYPLLSQVWTTVIATAFTFASTRYRSGAEVVVVFFAATTIDWLAGRLRHRITAAPRAQSPTTP